MPRLYVRFSSRRLCTQAVDGLINSTDHARALFVLPRSSERGRLRHDDAGARAHAAREEAAAATATWWWSVLFRAGHVESRGGRVSGSWPPQQLARQHALPARLPATAAVP